MNDAEFMEPWWSGMFRAIWLERWKAAIEAAPKAGKPITADCDGCDRRAVPCFVIDGGTVFRVCRLCIGRAMSRAP